MPFSSDLAHPDQVGSQSKKNNFAILLHHYLLYSARPLRDQPSYLCNHLGTVREGRNGR